VGTDNNVRFKALEAIAHELGQQHLVSMADDIKRDGFTNNPDAVHIMTIALATAVQLHIVSVAGISPEAARHTRELFIKMLINGRAWL
jgi:hypothetical protein